MRKSIIRFGASTLATVCMLVAGIAVADPLKLRLSVESTPGASTQHMLASFRDALKEEMGESIGVTRLDPAMLEYLTPLLEPKVSGSVGDQHRFHGTSTTLSAPDAEGKNLVYQWKKYGEIIRGANE